LHCGRTVFGSPQKPSVLTNHADLRRECCPFHLVLSIFSCIFISVSSVQTPWIWVIMLLDLKDLGLWETSARSFPAVNPFTRKEGPYLKSSGFEPSQLLLLLKFSSFFHFTLPTIFHRLLTLQKLLLHELILRLSLISFFRPNLQIHLEILDCRILLLV